MIWSPSKREPNREAFRALRPSAAVKTSIHADGVVFFNIPRGTVLTSNRVGARIWEGAANGMGLSQIADDLCREFSATHAAALRDTQSFLHELEDAGILIPA